MTAAEPLRFGQHSAIVNRNDQARIFGREYVITVARMAGYVCAEVSHVNYSPSA
jgi:hypothetical protein